MGLDVGSRTVGVAVSDPLGWTAQGLEIIRINEDKNDFGLKRLDKLVADYAVERFVIGLPKNMNNSLGPRAEKAREYGDRIAARYALPVEYTDERLTTVAASRVLIEEADASRKKQKRVIDKLAAQMILQGYLDQHN